LQKREKTYYDENMKKMIEVLLFFLILSVIFSTNIRSTTVNKSFAARDPSQQPTIADFEPSLTPIHPPFSTPPANWSSCTWNIAPDVQIPTVKCLEPLFANFLGVIISLVVIILFIMLTIGGFKYLTSGSDPYKVALARKTMTYAILGIFLLALSYLFIRLIEGFTGVKLTIFTINTE
jgi:hypothetical protein